MNGAESPLRIAVAVPTYRREEILVETLRQVLSQDPPPDEVIVVDQTRVHDPATEAYLRSAAAEGRIRWLRQEEPNLPRARNLALMDARSDVVIFLDDDVVLTANFVSAHLSNYLDPGVSAVAGRIKQANNGIFPPKRRRWRRELDYMYLRLDGATRRVGIANFTGCNHSVRRSAMLALGGYDANYIGWAFREDTDAALRLWKAGRTIVYDPAAAVTHLSAPAGGCRISESPAEWTISFPATYFAVRHLRPSRQFWMDLLILNVRRYVLRRANVLRPWRLPWALGSYCYGVVKALVAAENPRVMPKEGR